MASFELNVPDNYTVQNVQENEFINDKNSPADLAKYGLTYWVKFVGNAETYLWTTKTPPEEGKEYYGHVQTTSGKSLRFKTDEKKDGGNSTPAPNSAFVDHSKDITLGLVYKTVANIRGLPENPSDSIVFWEMVKSHTEELINISDKLNTGSQSNSPQVPTPSGNSKETQEEKAQPARDWEKLHKEKEEPDPEWNDLQVPPEFQ